MTVRLHRAARCVQLQLAQIHGAIMLRVGSVDQPFGGNFAGHGLSGRIKAQQRIHGNRSSIAADPGCSRRAVDDGVQAHAHKRPLAHHIQDGVQGNAFEARRDFAIHRNVDRCRPLNRRRVPVRSGAWHHDP
jgi:hypothetical protein